MFSKANVYFRLSVNRDVGPGQSRKEGHKTDRKEKKYDTESVATKKADLS